MHKAYSILLNNNNNVLTASWTILVWEAAHCRLITLGRRRRERERERERERYCQVKVIDYMSWVFAAEKFWSKLEYNSIICRETYQGYKEFTSGYCARKAQVICETIQFNPECERQ